MVLNYRKIIQFYDKIKHGTHNYNIMRKLHQQYRDVVRLLDSLTSKIILKLNRIYGNVEYKDV